MVFLSSNKRKLAKYEKLMECYLKNEKLKIKPNWKLFKVASGNKLYRLYVNPFASIAWCRKCVSIFDRKNAKMIS